MSWIFLSFATVVLLYGFVVFFGAPYVPSKKKDLNKALDTLYPVSKGDVLIDIGSGDGIVLRAAARRGAKAIGYELNPILVYISRFLSRRYKNISVKTANFWFKPLPTDTTVVYVFAVSRDITKLAKKVQNEATKLGRPLKLISYGCDIPGMTPEKTCGAHSLYTFAPLHQAEA